MFFKVGIENWSAWAPGVDDREAWQRWARGEQPIQGDGKPELKSMPPMLRRRLDRMGRMALHNAYVLLGDARDVPMVFASRKGETARSVELLQSLTAGEPLSPTEFGLSVHNAAGGLFSIARADHANCIAVSAGVETIAAALVEAMLLLQEHDRVLMVYYEEDLPSVFRPYADEQQFPYSVALLLTRDENAPWALDVRLSSREAAEAKTDPLPWGLHLLRLLAGASPALRLQNHRRCWDVRKHEVRA